MIAIIDYSGGNVASVRNAVQKLGYECVVTSDPDVILQSDKVIFPGQGRAAPAMKDLKKLGLDKVIKNIKTPFLGICLGMQLLLPFSEEDDTECLGIIPGRVRKFLAAEVKVPQIGWNTVTQTRTDLLFSTVYDTISVYFVNSYYVDVEPKYALGQSAYGQTNYVTVIKRDNYYGTQFHPEKSGPLGVQLLRNFCQLGEDKTQPSLIIPAIDIIGGKCVRLSQGDYSKKTVYDNNLVKVAESFVDTGVEYLHIIDLDGAKKGQPVNNETISKIVAKVSVPVQVGGGIRTAEQAKTYLESGVQRVILGTSALSDPAMIQEIIAEYGPGRVVISIDGQDGQIAIKGWQEVTDKSVLEFLPELKKLGVTTIIYTDIKRDGTLKGPNFTMIEKVLEQPFKVIIAGGVSTNEQAQQLNEMEAYGVIVGKALYEQKFDLVQAVSDIPSFKPTGLNVKPTNDVSKRLIACLDVAEGRVVKGEQYKNFRDAGDPVAVSKAYSDMGIDELSLLDIKATVENREAMYKLIEDVAREINIPIMVAGGVKTVENVKSLLNAGADKVGIETAAVLDPDLIEAAAQEFGSQCIVISITPKRQGDSWELYIKGGREATGIDAIEFCREMERRGAGELLVNSLDRDGTKAGYDLKLLRAITKAVNIPVIASSGAGKLEHFLEAFVVGKADAALAASLFHYREIEVPELKKYLADNGMPVRM